MSFFSHISRRFLNIPVYKGPFVLKQTTHRNKYPPVKFEQLYDAIAYEQKAKVEQPSPFHVVWRTKHFYSLNRKEKIICRKLGIHSLRGLEPMIVPNTPHYNRLLWDVKHLIYLRPVTFPDGLPTEEDIGRAHMNHFTGEFRLSDKNRPSQFRLNADNPNSIYEGNYLKEYLKKLTGILAITTRN